MKITQVSCSNCGSGRLNKIEKNRYECEYCGTMFFVESDWKGNLRNAEVSGVSQNAVQVFAVHGKLDVNGVNNTIQILGSSKEAHHVKNLEVSGVGNTVQVVLLDGANCSTSGVGNTVSRV